MLKLSDRTASVLRYLLEGIVAICTAYASVALFTWFIAQLAMARFWEPWVRQNGVLVLYALNVLVALTSGVVVGGAVGLVFKVRVAVLAGAFAAIALLAALFSGTIGPAPWNYIIATATLAGGIVVGCISMRRIRHA